MCVCVCMCGWELDPSLFQAAANIILKPQDRYQVTSDTESKNSLLSEDYT